MDKWTLKNRINRCQDRIAEDRHDILLLEQKIERLYAQKSKLFDLQSETEQYFFSKRAKCEALLSEARGRAAEGALTGSLDMYGASSCNFRINRLADMNYYVDININKIRDMIADLQDEIRHYSMEINQCRADIADIERKERENGRANHTR